MSRHHRKLSARPWRRLRQQILTRASGLCEIRNPQVCTIKATDVDHIVPLAAGGNPLDPTNLRAACSPCNQARKRRLPTIDTTFVL